MRKENTISNIYLFIILKFSLLTLLNHCKNVSINILVVIFTVSNVLSASEKGIQHPYVTTATIATFKAMTETPDMVHVSGYHSANDGAFGSLFFKLVDSGIDNGGTIIKTIHGVYKLQYSGYINIKWFGAKKNSTNTTPIINLILNSFNLIDSTVANTISTSGGKSVNIYIPNDGVYLISSPLIVLKDNVTILGDNFSGSALKVTKNGYIKVGHSSGNNKTDKNVKNFNMLNIALHADSSHLPVDTTVLNLDMVSFSSIKKVYIRDLSAPSNALNGLRVNAAQFCTFEDLSISNFSKHSLIIDDTSKNGWASELKFENCNIVGGNNTHKKAHNASIVLITRSITGLSDIPSTNINFKSCHIGNYGSSLDGIGRTIVKSIHNGYKQLFRQLTFENVLFEHGITSVDVNTNGTISFDNCYFLGTSKEVSTNGIIANGPTRVNVNNCGFRSFSTLITCKNLFLSGYIKTSQYNNILGSGTKVFDYPNTSNLPMLKGVVTNIPEGSTTCKVSLGHAQDIRIGQINAMANWNTNVFVKNLYIENDGGDYIVEFGLTTPRPVFPSKPYMGIKKGTTIPTKINNSYSLYFNIEISGNSFVRYDLWNKL